MPGKYIKIKNLKPLDREHLLHGEKIVAAIDSSERHEVLTVVCSWSRRLRARSDKVRVANEKGVEFFFFFSEYEKGSDIAVPVSFHDGRVKCRHILGKL